MASSLDPRHGAGEDGGTVAPEIIVTLEAMMPLIRERLAAGQSVRIYPRGTSMLPMLVEGRDSVVLSPLPPKLKKYDLPLYRRTNGQFVLHRVVGVGETYTCLGDNQFALESGLTHDQMIAVVSSFTRKGRERSVTDLSYRVYRSLWFRSRHARRLWRSGLARVKKVVSLLRRPR